MAAAACDDANNPPSVVIEKVEAVSDTSQAGRRRLLESSIKIYCSVTGDDPDTVSEGLTKERINHQLTARNLKEAQLVEEKQVIAKRLWQLDWTAGFSKPEYRNLTVQYQDVVEFTWSDNGNDNPDVDVHNVYLLQGKAAFG